MTTPAHLDRRGVRMSYDNHLDAEKIAALEPGDTVTFESSLGAFAHTQLHVGKVVRLTPTQVVVHYSASGRTIETRFRKQDSRKVGQGYGYLLDPTHARTIDGLTRDRRDRRRRRIDALAARWSRERENLTVLRELHAAVGEYLDAES